MELNTTLGILCVLALFAGVFRRLNEIKPGWLLQFKGWQKVFGLVGFIAALLIVMNPEFLALGLLGDTAFFDLLVLALGLQIHVFVTRAFHAWVQVMTRGLRWVGIPSLGLRYCIAVIAPVVASAAALLQKK